MQITVTLPAELASPLLPPGQDRAALEAIGVDAYRNRRITGYQLRSLLDISSRYELDGLLKSREVYDYTVDDFESELATVLDTKVERSE